MVCGVLPVMVGGCMGSVECLLCRTICMNWHCGSEQGKSKNHTTYTNTLRAKLCLLHIIPIVHVGNLEGVFSMRSSTTMQATPLLM